MFALCTVVRTRYHRCRLQSRGMAMHGTRARRRARTGRTLSAMFQNAVTRYSTICSRKWIFCNYYHTCFFTLESLEQINQAGRYAVENYPDVIWWDQNWRKGGLSERRIAIIKEYGFTTSNIADANLACAKRNPPLYNISIIKKA